MTLYELLNLMQNTGFRVDAQWGFFLTVHMALFGGIIYVDRPLKKTEKIVAIVLYSGFALVNYFMLANQIELIHRIYLEIGQNFEPEQSQLVSYYMSKSRAGWFSSCATQFRALHDH